MVVGKKLSSSRVSFSDNLNNKRTVCKEICQENYQPNTTQEKI